MCYWKTEEEQGRGHRVLHEDLNYRVAAAPTLPSYCYLSPALSSYGRLGPSVTPGTPAPADKEGKRETGRTPEGNRCLRYPGFTYRREERDRVQGKENQYITRFYCFELWNDRLHISLFVSDQHDVTKSCGKHSIQRKWLSVSFNPWPRWMTSPQGCRVGHHKTGPRHRNLNFLSLKKNPSFDLHIFTSFLGKCPITHANKTSEEFVWCCSELTFFTVHSFTKIFFFLKVALKLLSVLIFILQFVHNKLNKLDDYLT